MDHESKAVPSWRRRLIRKRLPSGPLVTDPAGPRPSTSPSGAQVAPVLARDLSGQGEAAEKVFGRGAFAQGEWPNSLLVGVR